MRGMRDPIEAYLAALLLGIALRLRRCSRSGVR
jgi:hypothetical protein